MIEAMLLSLAFALPLPSVLLDSQFDSLLLGEEATVLVAQTPLTPDQALAQINAGQGQPLSETGLSFSAGEHYYWVAFRVENRTDEAVNIYTEIRNPHINNLQLHELSSLQPGLQSSRMTGDYNAFDTREIEHRFFVFSSLFDPGEEKTFLLYADKYNESIKLPVFLRSEDNFHRTSSFESSALGFVTGIYAVIAAGLIILNIAAFKPLHLSLLTYVVSFSLVSVSNTGLGFQYLWTELPLFNSLSRSSLAAVTGISLLIFCYHFFEIGQRSQRERQINLLICACIAMSNILYPLYYVLGFIDVGMQDTRVLTVLQVGFLGFPIYYFAVALYYLHRDFKWQYLAFLLANLGVIASAFAIIFEETGLLGNFFLVEVVLMVGIVVDFIVLSVIIGLDFYRIKLDNQRLENSLSEALVEGARKFIHGQQIERVRLAQEVHDGVSSRLTALQMRLSALELPDQQLQSRLIDETRVLAQDVRRFSHNLSSVVLEKYGFVNAIEELLYPLEESNEKFSISFDYDDAEPGPKHIERELYFICLELVNNTLKHSDGDEIAIRYQLDEAWFVLSVSDNGSGYQVAKDNLGLGLAGINWRVELLGGELEITKRDGRQYHEVRIPLH